MSQLKRWELQHIVLGIIFLVLFNALFGMMGLASPQTTDSNTINNTMPQAPNMTQEFVNAGAFPGSSGAAGGGENTNIYSFEMEEGDTRGLDSAWFSNPLEAELMNIGTGTNQASFDVTDNEAGDTTSYTVDNGTRSVKKSVGSYNVSVEVTNIDTSGVNSVYVNFYVDGQEGGSGFGILQIAAILGWFVAAVVEVILTVIAVVVLGIPFIVAFAGFLGISWVNIGIALGSIWPWLPVIFVVLNLPFVALVSYQPLIKIIKMLPWT